MAVLRGIETLGKRDSIFRGTGRFDEYNVSLLSGDWAMLNPSWDDEHFSWAEASAAIAHFDCDVALEQ